MPIPTGMEPSHRAPAGSQHQTHFRLTWPKRGAHARNSVQMNLLSQLRRTAQPWVPHGAHLAGTALALRATPAPRLQPGGPFGGSPRVVRWVLVPMLAVAVGGSLLPTAIAASVGRDVHQGTRLAPVSAAQVLDGLLLGNPLRTLPHAPFATAGVVPFTAAPPKHRKHIVVAVPGTSAGIPRVAIAAYEHAQITLSRTDPRCHLSWEDVAGIGTVESDNGQTWGSAARVTSNGTLSPPIFGIPLNGLDGTPAMPARGGGWVRAEGPMQFLPATWTEYAQDGNNDGKRNPQNFFDAALTTGVFLCANGGNLNGHAGLTAAILAYNHSGEYASLVESWISFYRHVGAQALTAAGSGLLPTGTAQPITADSRQAVKPRRAVTPVASPATLLVTAALSSQATGAYSFSLHALAGTSELATGYGGVDTRNRTGFLVLELPGSGSLQMRLVGGQTYVALPPALASAVGAPEGSWVVMTSLVLSRLPVPFASALSLASRDLVWLTGQLAGATAVGVAATGRIDGEAATEYVGRTNFALAGSRLPGSSAILGQVAALVGSADLGVTAWVSENRIQSAVISLGRFVAGVGPLSLQLSFMDYGRAVNVTAPSVSPVSAPTTTTTTTSSTTTTTTRVS
jgi:hypothetical protein